MMIRNSNTGQTSISSSNVNFFCDLHYEALFDKKFLQEGDSICKCDCFQIEDFAKDIDPFRKPKLAYLELTPYCNNNCSGCNYSYKHKQIKEQLSFNQWQIILNKLKPSVLHLHITGGEPTLHPEFEKIIKYLQNLNISFTIFSNARWSNPESLLFFLSTIPQFKGFLVSLHGNTAVEHEAFTNIKNSFMETINNIKHATNRNIAIYLSTVITKGNYNKIGDIVKFSNNLGINYIIFNRYIGPFISAISPTSTEFKKAIIGIESIKKSVQNVQFGNCIPQCFQESSSAGCLAGTVFCTIDPWGNVKPCNHTLLNCGNLLYQSLEEVWNSRTMWYWRNLIPTQCKSCIKFSNCHAGCRAEALISGVDKDPLIRMAA